MVATQQEEVLRIFDLVAEEQRDHLQPARDNITFNVQLIAVVMDVISTLNVHDSSLVTGR